ncbi:unnamed protein product [Adineta ricciae]|uniref:F-box domain-containing protein n=1 Tax=Adineta ricciae TaxID=249248 RepID=A0A814ANH9_ADIRI|nr:unnamed protein product [Adineta ricciae]CAF0916018.1 unnamed protein product [Adineta ricciae]
MHLELLANELLLDLFTYIHSVDLLRAFFNLNIRFNHLIFYHFQSHSLDLRSISKADFDDLTHRYLPSIIDRLTSLDLSDDDETPHLPLLLLRLRNHPHSSIILTLNQFVHLRSLSLSNISSFDLQYDIVWQCHSLACLTHLTILSKYHYWTNNNNETHDMRDKINHFWAHIWNLSKLRHCHLDGVQINDDTLSLLPSSSSMEHLSLNNISHNLHCLSHLLYCTPHLHRLRTTIYSYSSNDHMTSTSSSLTRMTLIYGGSLQSLVALFEHLPNLNHLTITTLRLHLDGNNWQDLIATNLGQLNRFEMKMKMDYREDHEDIDDIVAKLLATYESAYWCTDHSWYVRCHWNQSDPYKCVTLYTLPYAFHDFDFTDKLSTRSTLPSLYRHQREDEQYLLYDRVKIVDCANIETIALASFYLFPVRFRHITFLNICLPFVDDHFLFHFASFDHLKSLNVCIYKLSAYDQLQTIFDRCRAQTCLRSFRCESLMTNCFSTRLFQIKVKQLIRRIDLLNSRVDRRYYHSKEECSTIVDSSSTSMMAGCEVLLIAVKSRISIVDIIAKVPILRLLIVECEEDKDDVSRLSSSSSLCWKDDLIGWLREHLPSRYLIRRDPRFMSRVQIWIDGKVKLKRLSASDRSKSSSIDVNKWSQFVRSSFRHLFLDG